MSSCSSVALDSLNDELEQAELEVQDIVLEGIAYLHAHETGSPGHQLLSRGVTRRLFPTVLPDGEGSLLCCTSMN